VFDFGRGVEVPSNATYVGETCAITYVFEDIAVGLTGSDVESPQRVRRHLRGRVVGPELTDEVVGAEPRQAMWSVRLR
jgi:hypothetical protein